MSGTLADQEPLVPAAKPVHVASLNVNRPAVQIDFLPRICVYLRRTDPQLPRTYLRRADLWRTNLRRGYPRRAYPRCA